MSPSRSRLMSWYGSWSNGDETRIRARAGAFDRAAVCGERLRSALSRHWRVEDP